MKVKRLEINGFRAIVKADIVFPDSNLAVFIGTNGKGKTAVLDLVAMFLNDFLIKLEIHKEASTAEESKILIEDIYYSVVGSTNFLTVLYLKKEFKWGNHGIRNLRQSSIKFDDKILKEMRDELIASMPLNKREANFPLLFYFKATRHFMTKQEEIKNNENGYFLPQFEAYEKAFSKLSIDFNSFLSWFRREEDKENEMIVKAKSFKVRNPRLEPVRIAIRVFFGKLQGVSFDNLQVERNIQDSPNFSSSIVISKNEIKLRLEQLSDGEKMLLMMVADIARRLSIANPSLANPLFGTGMILIDEIELHLHPKWQREVLPALTATFPNLQFLVTTHSPQVLSKVDKSEIFLLDEGEVFQLGSNPRGRDSNSILEEVMDTPSEPAEVAALEKELFSAIQEKKFDKASKVRSQLLEKSPDNTTVFQADAMMKRLQVLSQ